MFKEAIRYFRRACRADRFYIPARVNLSSALILTGKYAEAMAVLNEVSEIGADDPKVLNNRAVAMFMLGPSIRVDMFHQASDVLKKMTEKNPEFPDAFYNLARLQYERGRVIAARERTWKKFLQLEPAGVYARIARESTGGKHDSVVIPKDSRPFGELARVRLGDLDRDTKQKLSGFTKHSRNLGEYYADYYSEGNSLVLALDKMVELTEFPVRGKAYLSEIKKDYNPPHQIFSHRCGTKTLVYDNFALDIQGDRIMKVIYFGRE